MPVRYALWFAASLLLPGGIAIVADLVGAEFQLFSRGGSIELSPLWFLLVLVAGGAVAIRYQQLWPLYGLLFVAGNLLIASVYALMLTEPLRGYQLAFALAVLATVGFGLAKLWWYLD